MEDHKKDAIKDQTAAAVGGLVGGGLGAIAGPEGVAADGVAGSVGALLVSKYAPEYFERSILNRYLSNRKVVEILKAKIEADLDNSFLRSQGDFDQAMSSMESLMEAASSQDPAIGSLRKRMPRSFRWRLPASIPDEALQSHLDQLGSYCSRRGPIRIAASSICTAAVAVLRDLEKRFSESVGLRFDLAYREINGRALFDSLRSQCDADFVIGPLEALVPSDEGRKLPLRLIGPMFGERQYAFVSTKKRVGLRFGVWVYDRSSVKFQYHVGVGVHRGSEEQPVENARDIPDLVEGIPPGDMVVAWDPSLLY